MNITTLVSSSARALLGAFALSLLTGCDAFFETVESVEEPTVSQGTYTTVISPGDATVTAFNPTAILSLSAVGNGSHLPGDLPSHQPLWSVSQTRDFTAAIANPNASSTTLTVTYTGNTTIPTDDRDGWDRYQVVGSFIVKPNSVPEGMYGVASLARVSFYFGPDVANEAAETPRLTVLPARLSFLPGATRVLTVTYKGPDGTMSSGGVSPSGQGFTLNASVPPLKDGVSFPISLTYGASAPAANAVFTLNTSNGVSVSVPLTGLGL